MNLKRIQYCQRCKVSRARYTSLFTEYHDQFQPYRWTRGGLLWKQNKTQPRGRRILVCGRCALTMIRNDARKGRTELLPFARPGLRRLSDKPGTRRQRVCG